MRLEYIEPEVNIRTSRGLVKDIIDSASSVREPLTEYKVMLDLIHQDPVLARAFDIIVDFSTYNGYDFIGGAVKTRNKLRDLFYSKLNYNQVQTNIMYGLCYYGDQFLELRKENSIVPNELWPLETTEMRIQYDSHGKVERYWQRPFSMSGLTPVEIAEKEQSHGIPFDPDEVIHFRMKWIGSQVYSYNPTTPASTAIATKLYAQNYLMKIFMNMPPRYHMHLAGIGKQQFNEAKREFQSAKTNYSKAIAMTRSSDPQSRPTITKIEPPYDQTLLDVMKYLRNEVLTITGVPRSWVQESANENRGITEAEQRPFDVRIKAIHRNVIEPPINNKLLPLLGYSRVPSGTENKLMLRYNEISVKGETEILQNAGLLRDMGLKPKALVRYLDEKGIVGLDPTDFDETQLRKNMELNPSRERMDKNKEDMTSELDEKGVSKEGEAKIKEQDMSTRFMKYPYNY